MHCSHNFEVAVLLEGLFNVIHYYSALVVSLAAINAALNFLYFTIAVPKEQQAKFYFKESAFSRFLLDEASDLTHPYLTPLWCKPALVQLPVSCFLLAKPSIRFTRQFLQLKDRGLVALDWALPSTAVCNISHCVWTNLKKSSPVLIVIPNFDGDAVSLGSLCTLALSRGLRPVIFNRRGQGECPLATARLQQYGDPSDLRQAILYVRSCSPHARLVALGYGVGADLLLAYLGEFGSSSYLSASSAISPIYDPELICRGELKQPYALLAKIVFRRFVLRNWSVLLQDITDLVRVLREPNLLEAERLLHSRLIEGCCEVEPYWEQNAPLRDVDDIATPLLCISSQDDPFLTDNSIPYEIFQVYPNVMLAVTESGGHGTFLHYASEGHLTAWADTLALSFIKKTLEFAVLEERIKHASM